MKDKYFRIIELPEHDVLVEKTWDDETDSSVLDIVFHTEGVRLSAKLGYKTEEERDQNFNDFTEEQAQKVVSAYLNMIEGE